MLKRTVDILGALVGLMITAILLPFIAFAIKRSDPGPIFFGQERVGQAGRRFKCWKFRSMYIDAEKRKQELMQKNEMSGAIFKIKEDPRIFPFGHFLRNTSLDELPQFWNVLKGEMSLVGTRPPTPDEVEMYENWHRRRISIKPGITGLWQVSGRNEIDDFDEIVKLDLHYIDNWCIWYDIQLLFRTLKTVITRKGSC
jgi:exopolysaccharide biosynthesis polyprenyl glycosylphosphotransferase